MKRLFLIFVVSVFCIKCLGADGDITGVAVQSGGAILDVYLADSGNSHTNGTFTSGLGTHNIYTGVENCRLTVASPGYNDDGSTNITYRTVVGTKLARYAYPNNAYSSTSTDSGTLLVQIFLDHVIFSPDVVTSASLASGMYATNTFSSAAATWTTTTNNSGMSYLSQRAFGNWSSVCFGKAITANTMPLSVIGFHQEGQKECPVRVIRMTATGATSGLVTSVFVKPTTLDTSGPVPLDEAVGNLDISGFTQGEFIRCDFTLFPWIGDTNAVMDTADNVNTMPTPYYASVTNVCDRLGTYGYCVGLLDAVNGNNGTGTIVAGPINMGSLPKPYATQLALRTAMKNMNNVLFGHANVGACIEYWTNGTYSWSPPGAEVGAANRLWYTITPLPGVPANSVCIQATAGPGASSLNMLCLSGLVTSNTATSLINGQRYLWLTNDLLVFSGGQFTWWGNVLGYATANTVLSTYTGLGFNAALTGNSDNWPLVRGNVIYSTEFTAEPNMLIGNIGRILPVTFDGTGTSKKCDPFIMYSNIGLNYAHNGSLILKYGSVVKGLAVVQNVIEYPTQPVGAIIIEATSVSVQTNHLYWYNTFVGERCNLYYNDPASGNANQILISLRGNAFPFAAWKTDDNKSPFGTQYTNNWSVQWNVDCDANYVQNLFGNSFWPDFDGVNSVIDKAVVNDFQFVNDASFYGTGAGNGDYHLKSSSPLIGIHINRNPIAHDLSGRNRGGISPPGAYDSGQVMYGGMMMGQ